MRDEANINEMLVLANMESYHAVLLEQGKTQSEQLILLRDLAIKQMQTMVAFTKSISVGNTALYHPFSCGGIFL